MDDKHILSITAITDISGEGQRCTAAAIEYKEEIDGESLSINDFFVEGREITAVYTGDEPAHVHQKKNGRFVILELAYSQGVGKTREMIGHGPYGRSAFKRAVVKVCQKGDIKTAAGETYHGFTEVMENDKTLDTLADKFSEFTFSIPGTDKTIRYQLYTPKDYDPLEKLPLVLFIHDAGACSDDVIAPLAQGNGAVIWAMEEEQKKHKCFIVAPCYPNVCASDDFLVTSEAEYTIELIKEMVRQYPIDKSRIYGTGQSMGCMMLCEMNIRYPDLFAGCLLVAGQWNPNTMGVLKDKNFWIIVAERDKKAFPIMGACMESMEKAGGIVTKGALNAKASDEELREVIERLDVDKNNMHFTWFSGDSIIPAGITEVHPGIHHVMTWTRAYDISALRDWLFEQHL